MTQSRYKRTKRSGFSGIPNHWKEVRLKDIITKTNQRDPGRHPTRSFKYIDISSISNELFQIIDYQRLQGKDAPSRARKVIKENDIIYATVRPYLKRLALVPKHLDNEICSTGFCVVRVKTTDANPKFIFCLLLTEWMTKKLTSLQVGTSYPAITDKDLFVQFIPFPPFPEQQKIAEILSTVDEAIENSDAIIKETQQLKKGLMKKLFTEGIGHTRFKKTKIGRMPEEWDVKRLGDLLKVARNGMTLNQNPEKNGIKVSRIETIADRKINMEKVGYVKTDADISNYLIKHGDILFSHINSVKHIGKVAQFDSEEKLYHGMNLLLLRFYEEVNFKFGFYQLSSQRVKSLCERLCKQAVNQASLNLKDIRGIYFILPSFQEQNKIASILSEVDSKIENEQNNKAELEQLKKGLMQVLLTGKIRVKGV